MIGQLIAQADLAQAEIMPPDSTPTDVDAPFRLRFDMLFQDHGIPLAVMGMLVVFLALIVLIAVIVALPKFSRWLDGTPSSRSAPKPDVAGLGSTKKKDKSAGTPPPPIPIPAPAGLAVAGMPPSTDGAIPPEILAVIAAAVYEMEDRPVRIVRTRPLTASELAWTLEGRIRHHASHRLPRRN